MQAQGIWPSDFHHGAGRCSYLCSVTVPLHALTAGSDQQFSPDVAGSLRDARQNISVKAEDNEMVLRKDGHSTTNISASRMSLWRWMVVPPSPMLTDATFARATMRGLGEAYHPLFGVGRARRSVPRDPRHVPSTLLHAHEDADVAVGRNRFRHSTAVCRSPTRPRSLSQGVWRSMCA